MTLSDAEKLISVINRAEFEVAEWFVDWLNIQFPKLVFTIPKKEEWVKGAQNATVTKFEE